MRPRFRRGELVGWLGMAAAVAVLALVHGQLPSLSAPSLTLSTTPSVPPAHGRPPQQPFLSASTKAREKAACLRIGGSWTNTVCQVAYGSPVFQQTYRYTVSFDANGTVVPSPCADQAWASTHDCLHDPAPLARARADCLAFTYNGYGVHSFWHDDTDVCSV